MYLHVQVCTYCFWLCTLYLQECTAAEYRYLTRMYYCRICTLYLVPYVDFLSSNFCQGNWRNKFPIAETGGIAFTDLLQLYGKNVSATAQEHEKCYAALQSWRDCVTRFSRSGFIFMKQHLLRSYILQKYPRVATPRCHLHREIVSYINIVMKIGKKLKSFNGSSS